jgi:hypothetical protein
MVEQKKRVEKYEFIGADGAIDNDTFRFVRFGRGHNNTNRSGSHSFFLLKDDTRIRENSCLCNQEIA